jgi:hypothetical protein
LSCIRNGSSVSFPKKFRFLVCMERFPEFPIPCTHSPSSPVLAAHAPSWGLPTHHRPTNLQEVWDPSQSRHECSSIDARSFFFSHPSESSCAVEQFMLTFESFPGRIGTSAHAQNHTKRPWHVGFRLQHSCAKLMLVLFSGRLVLTDVNRAARRTKV